MSVLEQEAMLVGMYWGLEVLVLRIISPRLLVLQRAEVNEREITLEVYALNEASLPEKVGAEGDVVRMRPVWLPG